MPPPSGPGVLTKVGLGTFVDPELQGCAMNARAAAEPVVRKVEFAGDEWLFFPTITPRVAIIRATTADERGNLSYEHEGAFLGALDQALAARNNGGVVIAQVKRVVRAGSIKPQHVHVPGMLVDHIVVDPEQMADHADASTTRPSAARSSSPDDSFELPGSGARRRSSPAAPRWSCGTARRSTSASASPPTCRASCSKKACTGRSPGSSSRARWAVCRCWASPSAAPPTPTPSSPPPTSSPTSRAAASMSRCCRSCRSTAHGNVNVSKLGAKPYLTAGCGGFVDITTHAAAHRVLRLLHRRRQARGGRRQADASCRRARAASSSNAVEHVTFSGDMARKRGQRVTYVTERCVIDLDATMA